MVGRQVGTRQELTVAVQGRRDPSGAGAAFALRVNVSSRALRFLLSRSLDFFYFSAPLPGSLTAAIQQVSVRCGILVVVCRRKCSSQCSKGLRMDYCALTASAPARCCRRRQINCLESGARPCASVRHQRRGQWAHRLRLATLVPSFSRLLFVNCTNEDAIASVWASDTYPWIPPAPAPVRLQACRLVRWLSTLDRCCQRCPSPSRI